MRQMFIISSVIACASTSVSADNVTCYFPTGSISFEISTEGIPSPQCTSDYGNSHIHGYLFNCNTGSDIVYYSIAFDLSYGAKVFQYSENKKAMIDETLKCEKH